MVCFQYGDILEKMMKHNFSEVNLMLVNHVFNLVVVDYVNVLTIASIMILF